LDNTSIFAIKFKPMTKLAIFASGSGSNAQKIIEHFRPDTKVSISCILSNNSEAFVLERARGLDIPTRVFDRKTFYESDEIVQYLQNQGVDWVILAGFLWLIPARLIEAFPNRIINIHPALLPKYGGKGMYGMKVHQAVFQNQESETGITIHMVNEQYDEGKILFQAKCKLNSEDTPESIADKVHQLEYQYFPKVIEKLIYHQPIMTND
jgi:phosphoribosylglycinamide formyltransferase 1